MVSAPLEIDAYTTCSTTPVNANKHASLLMSCKIIQTLLSTLLLLTLLSQLLFIVNVEKRYTSQNESGTGTVVSLAEEKNTGKVEFSMCAIVKNENNNLLLPSHNRISHYNLSI